MPHSPTRDDKSKAKQRLSGASLCHLGGGNIFAAVLVQHTKEMFFLRTSRRVRKQSTDSSHLASLAGYSISVRPNIFAMKSPSASRYLFPPSCSLRVERVARKTKDDGGSMQEKKVNISEEETGCVSGTSGRGFRAGAQARLRCLAAWKDSSVPRSHSRNHPQQAQK